jgi:class 3 adenylate cyclase
VRKIKAIASGERPLNVSQENRETRMCVVESRFFNELNEMGVVIKVGLFTGPTIAVNANGLLDYFGYTVNMDVRIQQQSEGVDIIVSA